MDARVKPMMWCGPGLMEELVEALQCMTDNACAAARIKGNQYMIVCTEEEWNAHVAATERARAVLATVSKTHQIKEQTP